MPGVMARLKSIVGGGTAPPTITLSASQTAIELPNHSCVFELTSSATETIATINANADIDYGRVIYIHGATATAAITLTNNAGTTTKGQIDAGAGDITIDNDDTCSLLQRRNGTWIELSSQNN